MSYDNGAAKYREARILSSSREQLVPLLYEGLLLQLRRASSQLAAGDVEGKGESLDHAAGVVFELLAALDFEAGGDLAARLSALYAFFASEIVEISRTRDRKRLERVTAMVASLHEAWVEATRAARPDLQTAAET